MRRKLLWSTALMLTVLAVGALALTALRAQVRGKAQMARRLQQPIPVKAMTVGYGALGEVISAPVTIRPLTERAVNAQMSARALQVHVRVGDVVRREQELAHLDETGLREEIAQGEATVKEREANLRLVSAPTRPELVQQARIAVEQARQARDHAKLFWEQQKDYYEKRVSAARANVAVLEARPRPELVKRAEADVEAKKAAVEEARERVEQARTDKAQAESNRDYYRRNLERQQELFRQKLIARQVVDDIQKAFDESAAAARRAAAEVRAAEANVSRAQGESRQAQENLRLVLAGAQPELITQAKEELRKEEQAAKIEVDLAAQASRDAEQRLKTAQEELRLRLNGPTPQQINLARQQLEEAKTNLRIAQAQLRKVAVTAPCDGIVTARNVDPGEWVTPGGPSDSGAVPGAPSPGGKSGLFLIAEMSQMFAVASVEETRLKEVAIGQRAEVALEAFPNETFAGVVKLINPNVSPGTHAFAVWISIQPRQGFRPNLTGVARLFTSRRALVVPSQALITSPQQPPESTVFVIADGIARQRRVQVGVTADGKSEILGGLRGGERIVLYDLTQVRDGDKVNVSLVAAK